jgi:hypothetical protein
MQVTRATLVSECVCECMSVILYLYGKKGQVLFPFGLMEWKYQPKRA